MRLTSFVRTQLAIFALLTVLGLVVMSLQYVRLPAMFGIGRNTVTVQLASTGGLYPHANVTYRGNTVGVVKSVNLTSEGVDAVLSVDSGASIPADVRADVRSVSAVGEQYVDLVPVAEAGPDRLGEGAVIPRDRTSIPQQVGPMLDQADALLASIGDTKLQKLMDEAFTAFNGSGPDFQRLLDSTRLFLQEADANTDQTRDLVDRIGPLLDTQVVTSDAIRGWTRDMATFAEQMRTSDPELRSILAKGPGAAADAEALFQDLRPTLPILVANLVSTGEVGVVYNPSIEQILVLYPALAAALVTAAGSGPAEDGALVDFHLELNDPPSCQTGFLPPDQWRGAVAEDAPPTPSDLFCRVPQDDSVGVRGARNLPCMEYPGRRAPTPEECRTGYTPLGPNLGPIPTPTSDQGAAPVPASFERHADGPAAQSDLPATARRIDPATGTYIGPDNRVYRNARTATDGGLEALMIAQQG